jgi:hypothetical protein
MTTARDENGPGPLRFHDVDQVVPLGNPLVEVAGEDELHRLGRVAGLGAARTTKGAVRRVLEHPRQRQKGVGATHPDAEGYCENPCWRPGFCLQGSSTVNRNDEITRTH